MEQPAIYSLVCLLNVYFLACFDASLCNTNVHVLNTELASVCSKILN